MENEIICTGNNGNGCFMDSCGHDCGCVGISREKEIKTVKNKDMKKEFIGLFLALSLLNVIFHLAVYLVIESVSITLTLFLVGEVISTLVALYLIAPKK